MQGASLYRVVVAAFLLFTIASTNVICQEIDDPNLEVTRIKRDGAGDNRDLTVLLLNDNQKSDTSTRLGRYHNVKPVIGLLTSTARTFIQDGVTTEFATQILGTTLDNGRIYAQLLTKSSLVLYNKPSRVDDTSFIRPTSLPNEGKWNVKQELGFIDPNKFILKNTDYLKPQNSKMFTVYASKPSLIENTRVWGDQKVENDIVSNDLTARKVPNNIAQVFSDTYSNDLDNSFASNDNAPLQPAFLDNVNSLHRNKPQDSGIDFISLDSKKETEPEIIISKVKPDGSLPTFTVKNEFSPIFYYIDNVESKAPQPQQTMKVAKKLFGGNNDSKPKKTFTYAGFADFTTQVGDTVIVFTPNSIKEERPGGIEILQPSIRMPQRIGTKVTHLSGDIPIPTKVYTSPRPAFTKRPTTEDTRDEKALFNDDKNLKDVLYEIDRLPDGEIVQNMNFGFNMDVIQPSESVTISPQNTHLTDDLEVVPINTYKAKATEPLKKINTSPTMKIEKKSSTTPKTIETTTESNSSEEESDEESTNFDEDTTEEALSTTVEDSEESSEQNDEDTTCTNGIHPVKTMTTQYKTLTYLTTYFIPLDDEGTTTSVKSDVVVESTLGFLTNYECQSDYFSPSSTTKYDNKPSIYSSDESKEIDNYEDEQENVSSARPITREQEELKGEEDLSEQSEEDESEIENTTKYTASSDGTKPETTTNNPSEKSTSPKDEKTTERTTTERVEFTVTTEEQQVTTIDEQDTEKPEDSENEIDLIYKTLYTTYTYFTTYFQGDTTSVASHKSVVTNIVTSTIDLSKIDPSLLDAFANAPINPTRVESTKPTESLNSVIDLFVNKNVLELVENEPNYNSQLPTPILDDEHLKTIKPDAVKTYLTTYTFFTTIYVGTDANICSRSEVHTNYAGPESLLPTKSIPITLATSKKEFDFRNCKRVPADSQEKLPQGINQEKNPAVEPSAVVYDMLLSVEAKPINTASDSYVTDVKTSSSKGEQKLIEDNNVFDDQVSSESNIEEIVPSPTLLLQTSYTTFTYFTTLYMGKDSSKIKSHLETITNVVTETIAPKKDPEAEEPITYYTTFTYWTTLYKDKITTITSREEVISNVVIPTSLPAEDKPKESVSPIDTTPIEISSVPPKDLDEEIKPTQKNDLQPDDDKATFYTTYTYFTTFYVGNTSQVRSSLETITNIEDNTKSLVDDNQLGRSVGVVGSKNIIESDEKPAIKPTELKEVIATTKVPILSEIPTLISGSYIDNLFAEASSPIPPAENENKKILFSQVAVITGDSTIISDGKELKNNTKDAIYPSSGKVSVFSPKPEVVESSVTEPDTTTEITSEGEELDEEDLEENGKKKSRLTYPSKKPSFTPVIRPFSSRARPTFNPKRVPAPSGATTITRTDFTPTVTATPTLKSVKSSGFGSRKSVISSSASPSSGRRFSGRGSSTSPTVNTPSASKSSFGRGRQSQSEIQPSSRRGGFRTSSSRSISPELTSRSVARLRPTPALRLRGNRLSATVSPVTEPPVPVEEESEQQSVTDNVSEQTQMTSEPTVQRTTNPLFRFRRPLSRTPGSAVTTAKPATQATQATTKKVSNRSKSTTTTTPKTTAKSSNQVNILKSRQRPNALFPRRNLFRQPEPEPEEENTEEEVDENEENLETANEEQDNDYESSDKLEQLSTTTTTTRRPNQIQIKPFAFRRRTKRQADYGMRRFNSARRPLTRSMTIERRSDPESDTDAPVTPRKASSRYTPRNAYYGNTTPKQQASSRTIGRQPYIIRGEARSSGTTTPLPPFRLRNTRPPTRATTSRARLSSYGTPNTRAKTGRTRTRGSVRTTSRFRGNDFNSDSNSFGLPNDGKITVTHHIPTEVTIPIVSGKITEYKNIITAKPSEEILLPNQYSTSVNAFGHSQLVLASEATELLDNGATKLIKYVLQETPTKTVVFTPTTIRGRKTSFSHIVPSTVYNVEPVTMTVQPEINPNVPLANILLSQLLLGNVQQPAINPLLGLQGPGIIPQMPVAQTPITEVKTRPTTYVTTITDARETVLPITFRGKEILTTIVNPTVKVVTATEYITETIVTTPSAFVPQMNQNQLNSLLLPYLLQQQQQQQVMQTQNPMSGLMQPDLNLNNNLQLSNDLFNSPKPDILEIDNNEDYGVYDDKSSDEDIVEARSPPPKFNRPRPGKLAPQKVTSVVTLYVSGKTPGEFSTVLSTVVSDDTQTVKKREAIYYDSIELPSSNLPLIEELFSSSIDNSLEELEERPYSYEDNKLETQSLESIIGEVSKYINVETSVPNKSVSYKLFDETYSNDNS